MILKRRVISISVILSIVCLIAFFSNYENRNAEISVGVKQKPQIIIDAGHGGFDGGAVADDGTVEKDINLNISNTLSELLRIYGFEVIVTRSIDASTDNTESKKIATRKKSDLRNRLEMMKDYPDAVFVSVHLNKFTTSAAKGSQVFYSPKNEASALLGEKIQSTIVKLLQPENKRVNKQATASTYLLYNATIPAVIVECGFLSNKSELELLKNKEYQNKMAFCIFCGITEYFSEINKI